MRFFVVSSFYLLMCVFSICSGYVEDWENEPRRIVRTEKDKRFEELRNIIKQMKNHKKIKDFSNLLTGLFAGRRVARGQPANNTKMNVFAMGGRPML